MVPMAALITVPRVFSTPVSRLSSRVAACYAAECLCWPYRTQELTSASLDAPHGYLYGGRCNGNNASGSSGRWGYSDFVLSPANREHHRALLLQLPGGPSMGGQAIVAGPLTPSEPLNRLYLEGQRLCGVS